MPIYTYRCKSCEKVFDMERSISDAPLTDCPYCGAKDALKKVYSDVAVVYHGSGYYCTDHPHDGGCCGTCNCGGNH